MLPTHFFAGILELSSLAARALRQALVATQTMCGLRVC